MTRLIAALFACALAVPTIAVAQVRMVSTVPTGAVIIRPGFASNGDHIQAAIDANPSATVFWIQKGLYRLTAPLVPKDDTVLLGEWDVTNRYRLTVLSGAKLLTGWTPDGSGHWYVTGQSQDNVPQPGPGGVNPSLSDLQADCMPSRLRCYYPEEVFFNCVPIATTGETPVSCSQKRHETALVNVGPGEFFFDYATDRIYVGDDPNGQVVETSWVTSLFNPSADTDNVKLRGLVVEKFATRNGGGAVNICDGANGSEGWLADDNEIRFNHGGGVSTFPIVSCTVRKNYIHHNCHQGIGGAGNNILVEYNEVAYNNLLAGETTPTAAAPGGTWSEGNSCGTNDYWAGGSSKWVYTQGLILRGNYFHHNSGNGPWTDINNDTVLLDGNRLEFNRRNGWFHEIGCSAEGRYNFAKGNGNTDFPGFPEGAGLLVYTSANVELHHNEVEDNVMGIAIYDDNRNGGTVGGAFCPSWKIENVSVHHNTIRNINGGLNPSATGCCRSGLWDYGSGTDAYSSNVTFEDNRYFFGSVDSNFLYDGAGGTGAVKTDSQWQAYGHDNTGLITRP